MVNKYIYIYICCSISGCVSEYFENDDDTEEMKNNEDEKNNNSKVEGYKCVLNSKASEESMVIKQIDYILLFLV